MNNLCGDQIGYLALVCSPAAPDNGAGGERGPGVPVRSDRGKAKSSENYLQEINQLQGAHQQPQLIGNTLQGLAKVFGVVILWILYLHKGWLVCTIVRLSLDWSEVSLLIRESLLSRLNCVRLSGQLLSLCWARLEFWRSWRQSWRHQSAPVSGTTGVRPTLWHYQHQYWAGEGRGEGRGEADNIINVPLNALILAVCCISHTRCIVTNGNWINQSAFRFRLVITDYILHQTLMTVSILLDIKIRDNQIIQYCNMWLAITRQDS